MKNVYDGSVVADGNGQATVTMPEWFDELNKDLRYQLTAVGGPAPDLHIKAKLANGTFTIGGAEPGQEICWQGPELARMLGRTPIASRSRRTS